MKTKGLLFVIVVCAEAILCPLAPAADSYKPNVLIILADDLGYSDVGCYGSEIDTPNLDALAKNGVQFTQFYNTSRCWPTRASLMTGFYAQQVNRDTFSFTDGSTIGARPAWAPLLPRLLKPAGYVSYHSGKWHLDGDPNECGFDQSYQLLDDNRHFAPARHQLNGVDLPPVKVADGYYSTRAITGRMTEFLQNHKQANADKPFFAYVAYTAPHFPLHAPQATIQRYMDRYQIGWDQTRANRLTKQKALGLNIATALPALEQSIGPPYEFPEAIAQLGKGEVNRELPWDSLVEEQRTFQSAKMSVHAAMVDEIDQQVGALVRWLSENHCLENTIIFFLSDNGASAEIMVRGGGHDPMAAPGSPESYLCLGPGWSRCANTPFRRHKTWVHEGGISTPLIVHWPDGIQQKGLRHQAGHVVSIVPTVLDLVDVDTKPASPAQGTASYSGPSLRQAIVSNDVTNSANTLWWLHEDNKALRRGDFKIVKAANEPWQLYNLKDDRIEANDLATSNTEQTAEMIAEWEAMTAEFRLQNQAATLPPP